MFEEQNLDPGEPEESKSARYVYGIIMLVAVPVFFFFRHIGKEDFGLNVDVCLATFIVAIWIRWELRSQLWFWGVIAFLLVLHVPLFFLIQWPHMWVPGVALLPVGLADVAIILGAVRFVERFVATPSTSRGES